MRRTYSSPLRVEQQEATRRRILEAVLDLLREQELDDVSFPAIAKRANIAERTVFRHFPTKESLLDVFWTWWIDEGFGVAVDDPVSAEGFPDFLRRIYAAYERHEPVMRALIWSKTGREVRERSRHRRLG